MNREATNALAYTLDYMQHKQAKGMERFATYGDGYRTETDNRHRRRRERHTYITRKKALGIFTLALSVIIPVIFDGDATACIITVPVGLAQLLSKEITIHNNYFIEAQERKGK